MSNPKPVCNQNRRTKAIATSAPIPTRCFIGTLRRRGILRPCSAKWNISDFPTTQDLGKFPLSFWFCCASRVGRRDTVGLSAFALTDHTAGNNSARFSLDGLSLFFLRSAAQMLEIRHLPSPTLALHLKASRVSDAGRFLPPFELLRHCGRV